MTSSRIQGPDRTPWVTRLLLGAAVAAITCGLSVAIWWAILRCK